jgi:PAS domain S-box-containing protein
VRAIHGEESRDVEMFIRNPKLKGGVFIRVTATPLRGPDAAARGGVAVFRDITERKWTEAVLRDSEARFRSIVAATGSALVILSPDHRILDFNPEAERIHGRSRGEVLGEDFFELFLPREYWDAVEEDIRRAHAGEPTLDLELPILTADGTTRTMLWRVSRLTSAEGQAIGVIATGHDITERKEIEEAQHLRQLAAHLQSARENERKSIAREIHDELGQALTGLKFEFSHLARRIAGREPELKRKLAELESMIDDTVSSVRRIAAELRPQILDQLGLPEAIRWQAREFESRTGIACRLDLPEEIDCPADPSTALFRIFQESLTNVARHAGARRVDVRLHRHDGQVVLEIEDDGRGITEAELSGTSSFGLLGMRERARMFGGAVLVEGAERKGTTIRVRIPC